LQKVVRVLVIAESVERADIVREGLLIGGHEAAEVVAPDGPPLPAVIERSRPDAVVLQTRSPDVDLLDRTVDAMGTSAVPLIIFTEDSSERTISLAVRAGAAAYIVDGLQAARVPAILQVALVRFEVLAGLRTELSSAQQRLAERKFVERAKGLLMKARGLSEDEAYHTLRRMAMERNRRLGDVAKSVLEMADLLN
jgi:response regulator NasT